MDGICHQPKPFEKAAGGHVVHFPSATPVFCFVAGNFLLISVINQKHLAATGPNVEVLREFLSHGASVHLRNREGHTPLYRAAHAGLADHVGLLREAGAHLHTEEVAAAKVDAQKSGHAEIWEAAGIQEQQG